MTSKEIEAKQPYNLNDSAWLREIALQLALLNEKLDRPAFEPPKHLKARK